MPRKREEITLDKVIDEVRKGLQPTLNAAIDRLLHPHFKKYPWLILIDGLLHGLVEYPETDKSIRKFLKYNAPKLVRELEKQMK